MGEGVGIVREKDAVVIDVALQGAAVGQAGGGQGAYGDREKQSFANALDRILTRLARG